MLPHVGRRCGVVWTVPGDEAEALLALSDEEFLAGLQQRFGFRLGRLRKVGRRSSYPLRLVYAPDQQRSRSLIIGNAAHAIHPISAQGFNLGLRDVAVLAELLADAQRDGTDIGSDELLQTYCDRRRRDHERMIAYTDGLVRIFSQTFLPVRVARSAGLQAIDMVPGLKRALARRTMGFGGHVPRLARGEPLVGQTRVGRSPSGRSGAPRS
jgi:2-octaprenyl-6-methoxyphenol hydroxylase